MIAFYLIIYNCSPINFYFFPSNIDNYLKSLFDLYGQKLLFIINHMQHRSTYSKQSFFINIAHIVV